MVETSFAPSSIFSDSLKDGNLNITWQQKIYHLLNNFRLTFNINSYKFTTCSSSAPELSSGIVSGKIVSFGDDNQVLCCCYYFYKITFRLQLQNFDNDLFFVRL